MGYEIVISLPVILLILIVALAFYLLGRARGRTEAARYPQYFGPPAPPFQAGSSPAQDKPSQQV